MEETQQMTTPSASPQAVDVRELVREALKEFVSMERAKAEPAYKTELIEERKRREMLEQRVNDLVQENRKARAQADEIERSATIRTELQRLGVNKIDLAFKAVKDDIHRTPEGQLVARSSEGDCSVQEYLKRFVEDNPELLPARISGGSGLTGPQRAVQTSTVDLDRIKPGMSAEELAKVRQEIARIATQSGV